jgi:uncharacterized protein (DUF488 family)
MAKTRLFSIGHSNHDLVRLAEILQQAGVTAVADVRSQPYSQRYPQYNRPELQQGLAQYDIAYAFLGDLLGGRPRQPDLYDDQGRVKYERVRATRTFRQGIQRLIQALDEYTVAMLCSEEDPLDCHRGLMIAPALVELGILPAHLRADGSIETTADFENRLLAETKVDMGFFDGLFANLVTDEERRQLLADAYRKRAQRKAFRLRPENTGSPAFNDGDDDQ